MFSGGIERDQLYEMLKCGAHLKPSGLLRHSLEMHIIILCTLASFLKESLIVL